MKKKLLTRCFICLMAVQLAAGSLLPLSSPAAAESAAAVEAAAGIPRMLITEMVPDSGGDDALGEDPYEYLEVYNNSDQSIDFKDYSILYRYPGEPGHDLFWRPYTDAQIIIQPKQAMVFWAVTTSGEPKTVADFNQHFQTSLVENKDIVRIPGGLNNLRERTLVVATNTGTDIVRASYNPGVIDTAADLSVEYGVPEAGSLDMKKLSSKTVPASPGTFNPANVPADPVRIVDDPTPPTVKDLTDPSGIDLIKPIELMAEAADDRLLASVNLYYKSNKTPNYKMVTLPRGADGHFRYSLEKMEWFGSPTLDYYFQASDTFHVTSTAPRTLSLAGNEKSPALNVLDGDVLSGERVLIGSSATEGSMSLSIDGQPVSPTERALEKTAYFVFEADDINIGQNVTTMGSETLHLIPFQTQDYKTMVVAVRPDLFKYGQANPIALRAGSATRPYYEDQPEPGLDDFNIRNVRLVLADGTVIRDPKYANPATILDMGDNGRFLPVVYFNFTIPEHYWDGISYRWNTAAATDGPHRVEVSLPDGSKNTANVKVDNQGPVVSTNITEGSSYKGAFEIRASASDTASSVKSFEVKLDDMLIEVPYSTSSAALTPGEHNLVFKAVDAGGKTTEKTIKFTTPVELPVMPLLAAPADGAQDTDTNVSLQVSVSDPTGDPLKVKFFKGQKITAADAGVTAYKHTADVEPPLTLTSPGETQLTAEEQTVVGASDDRYVTTDSTEQFPYQRFEVEAGAETGAGDRLELIWEGHSLKGRKVGLYAWNYTAEKWDSLASTVAVSEEDFTLSAAVDGGSYARNGKVQVLIQDEIPRREQYDFTFASIPDTQIYAEIQPEYYESQVNFLRDAKESMNIQYVMHVGDVVNSAGIKGQWERADKFMKVVEDAQIPWGVVAGNHDVFDGGATSVPDYSEFSKYFGENRFKDKPYYGESYKENKGHYDLISAGGNDFIFVYMGWGLNDEDMGWMNSVLKQYPDRKAVIVVHEYLQNNAARSAAGNQIYQKVVVPNPNVWMVMSGHFTGSSLRTDQIDDNKDGQPDRKVYQILNDYQGIPNGGNGYLKLLHFDTETDTVYVNTYSPYLDDYNHYDPSKDEFKLSVDLKPMVKRVATDSLAVKVYSNEAIGSAQATSGSTATVNWNGLKGSTNYEWYALAEDSFGGRSYSDIWSFRTRLTVEAPQGVKAENVTTGSAQLSWSPVTASDGSSVTYQVYGSNRVISTVTGTVYNWTGLEPDTSYTFQVKAVHSTGAISALSEPVSFKTSIDLPALQKGLQRFIASGKVTHPLAIQLENALSQAESHLRKGQQDQAAKKIEDFIKHLGNKAHQELASADARQWLNDKAEVLLRVWGR
ncbi:FIMAH domain-containing protein [Paenibacillus sp. UNC451MF]|uniref:FIMAH domain-containing protein n=1 Tax=Paenibacillus sp. UNC451MF TaxID=1449063 RepID=UPI0004901695|nr:metallophosphoesterase [Paenibacillus sp. UNC451MF]